MRASSRPGNVPIRHVDTTLLTVNLTQIFLFALGLGSFVSIRVVGLIYVSELLAILLLPLLVVHTRRDIRPLYLAVTFIMLWIIGTIISSIVNNVSYENALKGIGTVGLMLPSILAAYYLLVDNLSNITFYLYGKAISVFLGFFLFTPEHIAEQILVKGLLTFFQESLASMLIPTFILIAHLLWSSGRRLASLALVSAAAFGFLVLGSRGGFFICLVSSLLIWITGYRNRPLSSYAKFDLPSTVLLTIFGLVLIWLGFKFYSFVAVSGFIGEYSQIKYLNQSDSEIGILVARADFIQALLAVKENPIFGYGPYAVDSTSVRIRVSELIGDYRSLAYYEGLALEETMVPRHSFILGAWVFSGILAVPFWLYVIYLCVDYIKNRMQVVPYLIAFLSLTIIFLIWNVFFSPLQGRTDICFTIAVLLIVRLIYRNEA